MIRRLLTAIAFAFVAMAPASARAQSTAELQSMLADIGQWMQEYQAVMADANAPFLEIETYYTALDGFADGSLSARRARREIEGWNERAIASMDRARAGAAVLRQPPRLAGYGPEGLALQRILDATRDNLLPTVTEMERVVETVVSLGLGALDDRAKGFEARERAFYSASIQLTLVDRSRIDLSAAMLSRDNPNSALLGATQHYYDFLVAMPRHALEAMDGGGNRAALISSLREYARSMRQELARGRRVHAQTQARARELMGGPAVEIGRLMNRMLDTFPPSFAAYEGLASDIDAAVVSLENGREVRDVWAESEINDRPFLDEIDRLEHVRAAILAENQRAPL